MTNDEMKNLPTVADAPRLDGFEGYEDAVEGDQQESSARVIQGALLRFPNEATWETGDGEKMPPELELIAIDIARVVQKWKDGMPVETIILVAGQKFPDIGKLNETVPKKEWVDGPDGKPRGPWQAQHIVYLLDPKTMNKYSWPTGTVGGAIAVSDLVDKTKWMRRFRGQNIFPIVTLSDVFMNTRFGGRQRPHFDIRRWVTLGDDGRALPEPEQPKLVEVKPPSAKEVTKDDVPF